MPDVLVPFVLVAPGSRAIRKLGLAAAVQKSYLRGCQVKNTSPRRDARNIFGHPAPAILATLLLLPLDRFGWSRSGRVSHGATGLGCFFVPVVSFFLS